MNRDEAKQFAAELCEAISDGGWGEVLQVGLDNESIEILRVLRQINGDVERLEQRERELSDALVTRLMPLEFDDGTEPEPAGANASDTKGSAAVEGSEPAAVGLELPAGANASDTNGSAPVGSLKPATPAADPLAELQIQQRRTA